jgi:hypothetical protein
VEVKENMVTLSCLNPEGLLDPAPPEQPPVARLDDLNGKKIRLLWDGKMGGENFCMAMQEVLRKAYPATSVEWAALGDMDAAAKAKNEADAFVYAVGDSGMGGWIAAVNGAALEKELGKPGVVVVGENAFHTARMAAKTAGAPALRIVALPSIDYYPNRLTADGLAPLARAVAPLIVAGLTQPVPVEDKEAVPAGLDHEETEVVTVAGDTYEAALEQFNQLYLDKRWGDGLPLVPPTQGAVARMLGATKRSPDDVIGQLPYRGGIITVGKIAVNAVMAGAKPEYLPIVIAAMECIARDNGFHHFLSSEGSFTLAIVVTGALGKKLDMNSGVGLLGHGWRANSTIGRAVRLCLSNIGYLRPGEVDMALIGRPSSHTFYTFAENQEQSPWEPYHVSQGFTEADSCVTVSTVGGATGFGMRLYGGGVVEPWSIEAVLDTMVKDVAADRDTLAQYKLGFGNPFAHLRKHLMIVHPELAILLQRLGYTRQRLVDHLFESAKVPYEELSEREVQGLRDRINTKPGGLFFANDAIPDDQVEKVKAAMKPGGKVPVVYPQDLHVIVSGAIPGYSFGMTYFHSSHVTRPIEPVA